MLIVTCVLRLFSCSFFPCRFWHYHLRFAVEPFIPDQVSRHPGYNPPGDRWRPKLNLHSRGFVVCCETDTGNQRL